MQRLLMRRLLMQRSLMQSSLMQSSLVGWSSFKPRRYEGDVVATVDCLNEVPLVGAVIVLQFEASEDKGEST